MSKHGSVDAVSQVMVLDELGVVERCTICHEEEDTGEQEFVVDTVALDGVNKMRSQQSNGLALNLSAACGPWPRLTSVWRALGSSNRALAMQRRAS
jgi:hypothetical protein